MKKSLYVNKVKKQLLKIFSHFDLKFDLAWMNYLFVPKEVNILIEFNGLCPDPLYNKYGLTRKERLKNLNKFIGSKDFDKCLNRWGGQVYRKRNLRNDENILKLIEDKSIKNKFVSSISKIKKKLKLGDISLLTEPKNDAELRKVLALIYRHEVTHIILRKNGIYFQKKGKKYWKYDEGLVTYCDCYVEGNLNKLEKFANLDKHKGQMEHWYYVYAKKFRELFKDKNTSVERKKEIIDLYKNLKS